MAGSGSEGGNPGSVVRARRAGTRRWEDVTFAELPDLAAARRRRASMKRVDVIDITIGGDRTDCHLRGVAHRRPVIVRIPLRVGLGLIALGVPAVVDHR